MKITTEHPASSFGIPVILGDDGEPLDYGHGVRAVRDRLGLSRDGLAARCGVSARTVEGWELGRVPSAPALMAMAGLLKSGKRAKARNT